MILSIERGDERGEGKAFAEPADPWKREDEVSRSERRQSSRAVRSFA